MLRGLGSVESVGSKRRQAAWTRQVATAGAVLTCRPLGGASRARPASVFPVQARAGTCASEADATFLFGKKRRSIAVELPGRDVCSVAVRSLPSPLAASDECI